MITFCDYSPESSHSNFNLNFSCIPLFDEFVKFDDLDEFDEFSDFDECYPLGLL